jgi:5-methyltetrahydrofolate--homocysteine methyltransferase
MMGIAPNALIDMFEGLDPQPLAMGANCGVGASDLLASILSMSGREADRVYISKGNCGIPQFQGPEIVYSGTPELMSRYAALAVDSGARIVGGCCGTSPEHLAAMRASIDAHTKGERPTLDAIIENIGPLTNAAPEAAAPESRARRSGRRG